MFKRHNLNTLVFGILFIFVLQEFTYQTPVFRYFIPLFLAFNLLLGIYNYFYLKKNQCFNYWVWFRPMMLAVSVLAVFISVPNGFTRLLVSFTGAILIAFFELALGKFSDNININETLLISFGGIVGLCALNFTFPGYSILFTVIGFLCSVLVYRSFMEFIPQSGKIKLVTALTLGFFSTQLFWALSFLPLHYSALALTLFSLVYFLLIVNYYYLFNILSPQKIKFHLWLVVICIAAVFLGTPWKII